jgi:hypothetical protein
MSYEIDPTQQLRTYIEGAASSMLYGNQELASVLQGLSKEIELSALHDTNIDNAKVKAAVIEGWQDFNSRGPHKDEILR